MNIQTMNLEGLETVNVKTLHFEQFDKEKSQLLDQIEMLEREIDRQSTIIDALIKAIKVIERG